jgi:SAM-dependent methyltransferase
MDVRRLEVRIDRRDVRLTIGDAAGEREHIIAGDGFQRVAGVAKPLFDELSLRSGPVFGITIDPLKRRLWAAGAEGGCKLEGDDYDARAKMLGQVARAALAEIRENSALPDGGPSTPGFWDALFQRGRDGWELGRPAPPLLRWFLAHPPRGQRLLVVGAGRGNEALLLHELGAHVTALDFSDEAVTALKARAAAGHANLTVVQQDLFTLTGGDFDLVVEHTCFCAIDPGRRDEYVAAVAAALRPGGELIGLFWDHGRPGGPPFTTTREELERRFAARFDWISDEVPRDSVAARQGQEMLIQLKKR